MMLDAMGISHDAGGEGGTITTLGAQLCLVSTHLLGLWQTSVECNCKELEDNCIEASYTVQECSCVAKGV